MNTDARTPSMYRRLGRRQLLALGAATGAATMLPALAHAKSSPAPAPGGIGYVMGSESGTGLGWSPSWLGSDPLLVAPAGMIAPDPGLAGGAVEITVYGLSPRLPPTGVSEVTLDALFASFLKREKGPFPFSAWSFSAGNPGRSSSRVAFKMPVDSAGAVSFALTVVEAGATRRLSDVLSLDPRAAAKLRPGFYLLGVRGTEFTSETTIDPAAEPDESLSALVLSVRSGA